MTQYVIGDIQGCLAELKMLLAQLAFNPGKDTLWFTGDLVNRGPQSLETLRLVYQHDSCMQMVLGNHDLHLLALNYGYGKLKHGDTISDILNATDKNPLLGWLVQQPLMLQQDNFVMVHAGIWPQWSIEQAQTLAHEVECVLQNSPKDFFAQMYGNKPNTWCNDLQGKDRLRFITNVFTRMRAITTESKLDFDYKSTLAQMPSNLIPWFQAEHRRNKDKTILFGHWSALGLYRCNNVICLDTGALWGGSLTALNTETLTATQTPSQTKLNLENI